MIRKTLIGDIGFFLGVVGLVILVLPYLPVKAIILPPASYITSLVLAAVGLIFSLQQRKSVMDEVVKSALIINSIVLVLGIVSIIVSFV